MQSFINIGGSVFEKSSNTRQTFVVLFIGCDMFAIGEFSHYPWYKEEEVLENTKAAEVANFLTNAFD